MIHDVHTPAILEITRNILEAGVNISGVPGTPVYAVSQSLAHPGIPVLEQGMSAEAQAETVMSYITTMAHCPASSAHTESYFTAEAEAVIEAAAGRVRALLQVTRGMVNPMVKSTIEDINKELDRRLSKVTPNLRIVESDSKAALYNNEVFISLCEKNVRTPINDVVRPNYFGGLSTDLGEVLRTSILGAEEQVGEFLANVSAKQIQDVWDLYFSESSSGTSISLDPANHIENILVVLFCMALEGREWATDVTANVSLDLARVDIINLKNSASAAAYTYIARLSRQEDRGVLVRKYPSVNTKIGGIASDSNVHEIFVDSVIYKEFLAEGGSPDVIMGAFLSTRDVGKESLLANKEKHLNAWSKLIERIRDNNETRRFDIFKRALVSSLYNQITEDFVVSEGQSFDRQALITKLREEIMELQQSCLNDVYNTVLNIVAVTVYGNPHARDILQDMNAIAAQNPGLDIRHVASSAQVNYITRWVRSQIVVG